MGQSGGSKIDTQPRALDYWQRGVACPQSPRLHRSDGVHMSEGLVVVSSRPFEDTLSALIASVKHRQVFGIVDHAANAQGAGFTLSRTTVVTFGGAKAGTPLMQAHQTLGLDLPLRALVYETAQGQVRIAYREPPTFWRDKACRRTPSLRWAHAGHGGGGLG